MDLAAELRLKIYEQALLIDGRESGKNHSALLRVSKLIHRESEPVLYCDNTFHLQPNHAVVKIVVSESWESEWDLRQARTSGWPKYTPPSPIRIDMLFGLRQLTMRMCDIKDLHTGTRYDSYAYRSFTTICHMLSSASRLKTLTITNVPPQGNSWTVHQLMQLLFPVFFLPKTATIRVEGGSPALHTALEDLRRQAHPFPDYALSTCGTLLSRAMDLLAEARQKADAGTSSMLHIALNRVLFRDGCVSVGNLRGVIASLQTLENIVGKVEAELAAL